jgi:hypothetical protein
VQAQGLVTFLSALDETEDKVKAFRSGGADYIWPRLPPFYVNFGLQPTSLSTESGSKRSAV